MSLNEVTTMLNWFFDEDGYTKMPLFHGTNRFFLPSIRAHGLGGRDIVKELDALAMYQAINESIRSEPATPIQWSSVYLHVNINHAHRNEPEIFSLIRKGLRRMRIGRVAPFEGREELMRRFPAISAYMEAPPAEPIVICLPRLHVSRLLGHDSDDPWSSVGTSENFSASFRLKKPVFDFRVEPMKMLLPRPRPVASSTDKLARQRRRETASENRA